MNGVFLGLYILILVAVGRKWLADGLHDTAALGVWILTSVKEGIGKLLALSQGALDLA